VPSGAEALPQRARELAGGALRPLLGALDVVVVASANPDGRDLRRRTNASGVNLSTDFVLMTQPESRALAELLRGFAPHAVLDLHESASGLPASARRAGSRTERRSNREPLRTSTASAALLRRLCQLLARTGQACAQPYVSEIIDVSQPCPRGSRSGTSAAARVSRGALGSDREPVDAGPACPTPPTWPSACASGRSARAFSARGERYAIRARADAARGAWRRRSPVALGAAWTVDPARPEIVIPLRRAETGALVPWRFAYRGRIAREDPLALPGAYLVPGASASLRALLAAHGVALELAPSPSAARVVAQRVSAVERLPRFIGDEQVAAELALATRESLELRDVPAGALRISLGQPAARLVALLLEPRSTTGIFRSATSCGPPPRRRAPDLPSALTGTFFALPYPRGRAGPRGDTD
jgi:hypothetical protein